MSDPRSAILITAADLAARLDAREPVVVLDVSDELAAAPAGRSFIPGAFATCLATHFSGAPSKAGGKRPLPDSADFQAKARGWGVNPDTLVVVYDDNAGAQAARAWWTFRWAGFGNVRLLDGGLGAWKAAGRPVASAPATAGSAGSVVLSAGQMPTLDADQSARFAAPRGPRADRVAGVDHQVQQHLFNQHRQRQHPHLRVAGCGVYPHVGGVELS